MQHYKIIFSGKVQGVSFRRNTYLKAVKLGICGYVRNLKNGSVEVVAQGKRDMIDALIEFCKDGQTYAKVEKIKVEKYNSNKIWPDFSIKHEA